ncbi:hypothetical protein N803_06380 [Knoellia subterranea KCTC 19937]|uniref:Glycosyl transferase family 1 n=1 Tax=Knoellia subterranea KCTC 19937 TaxID=1385521 RepID=A0A0A0JEW8_9MICO|nr:hypothetical protein N803_06380 [Knoellia subterranea KCTC 19937]
MRATGATVIEVDWADWKPVGDLLRTSDRYDIVFAHASGARDLALYVNEAWGADLYVMCHGAFHDYVYTWSDKVTAFLAASPSLVDFLVRIGKVDPWRVEMVANGVPDHVLEMPLKTLEEKLSDGVGRIVMASRIAQDKSAQFPVAREVLLACQQAIPNVKWQLDVLGDGPLRPRMEREMGRFAASHGLDVNFAGWVPPEEVPIRMNSAVIGLVAGMGGIRTLAAGALCVGVGARDNVGLQVGQNLRAGLWSNFGDHGCPQFTATPIADDIRTYLRTGPYEEAQQIGRLAVKRARAASVVDGALLSALQAG